MDDCFKALKERLQFLGNGEYTIHLQELLASVFPHFFTSMTLFDFKVIGIYPLEDSCPCEKGAVCDGCARWEDTKNVTGLFLLLVDEVLVVELPADILLNLLLNNSQFLLAPTLKELTVPYHIRETIDVQLIGVGDAVIVYPSLHCLLNLFQRTKDLYELIDCLAMADICNLLLTFLTLLSPEPTWCFTVLTSSG